MSVLLSSSREAEAAVLPASHLVFPRTDSKTIKSLKHEPPSGQPTFHETVMDSHDKLRQSCEQQAQLVLDGQTLNLTQLVRGARYGAKVHISQRFDVVERIRESVEMLHRKLDNGHRVYGVNTGFGGSADVRTDDVHALQQGLLQHHIVGILTPSDIGKAPQGSHSEGLKSHALPREVVKGGMITRCNSLLRGHSSVRFEVIQTLAAFINEDLIPIIPLRGSISASGDLTPLAYVAGALEGHPGIFVQSGAKHSFQIMSSDEALKVIGMKPITFRAKEGLGLMNGTAISTAAGALAHHDVERLAVMVQTLTALTSEGLRGTRDSFHPFIAKVRPHRGQIESAKVIYDALASSKLERDYGKKLRKGLAQDRYALRTASQWIGPQLEDLSLARDQLAVELNSTTDNPLIDIEANKVHHGGNFQAMSVTSAMEKTRLAAQMLGKILFAQTSELINVDINGKLPPNLAFDDPSVSFALKGLDINMASYMSELAFLANPVGSHVQSAEMNNQAINSLALISARYTQDAAEVLSLMASVHLYTVCQALDLQVLYIRFMHEVHRVVKEQCHIHLPSLVNEVAPQLTEHFISHWDQLKTFDLVDRCTRSVKFAISAFVSAWVLEGKDASVVPMLTAWSEAALPALTDSYTKIRQQMLASNGSITAGYLGRGTRRLFEFVRVDLDVPILRGLADHPSHLGIADTIGSGKNREHSIGGNVSRIYDSVRSDKLWEVLFE